MSRLRRATIAASFGYLQYALAMVSGFVMVPLTLSYLGTRRYGLWLASGELLGYAAMVDLGVIGVLPWMLAQADGRGDREAMRRLVSNGFVVGSMVGLAFGLLATALWLVLPSALSLDAADREAVGPPLALLVLTLMMAYPARVFAAVVNGLQDVVFSGWLSVAQSIVNIGLTAGLLVRGYGLYAPAIGACAAACVSVCGATVRARMIAPDVMRAWPRPSRSTVRTLLVNGLGAWSGGFGWQLLSASNGLIIAALGRPEWIPVYACSSRLTTLATQLTWILPDAGLVGLAHLQGEQPQPARLRSLVLLILRLHLLLAGGAACVLLVFNPLFVAYWVGTDLFAGMTANAWLALAIVVSSVMHGVMTAASVLGDRLRVGIATLVAGTLQVACAWTFGRFFGLTGVAAAGVMVGVAVSVPAGVLLLRSTTAITASDMWNGLLGPWGRRVVPLALVSGFAGVVFHDRSPAEVAAVAIVIGLAYVWQMRPLLSSLPVDQRWTRWLVSLRVIPAPSVAHAATEQV